jgi:hypothetical protein
MRRGGKVFEKHRQIMKPIRLTQLPRVCRFMSGEEMVDWAIDFGFDTFVIDRLPSRPEVRLCDLGEKWIHIRHLMQ